MPSDTSFPIEAGGWSDGRDFARASRAALPPRHSFERHLIDCGLIAADRLAHMMRRARSQGVSLMRLILAEDGASERDLFAELAAFHGLAFHGAATTGLRPRVRPGDIASCLADNWIELETADGRRIIAAAPLDPSVTLMRHLPGSHRRTAPFDAITTPAAIRRWITRQHGDLLLDRAICSLAEATPEMSAHYRLSHGQWLLVAIIALATPAMLIVALDAIIIAAYSVTTLVFMAVAGQRLFAFATELGARHEPPPPLDLADSQLPVYTILVPLYREPHMVERIATAVLGLDYPRGKLDIKLVLEADDGETRAAARRLPGCIDVVTVPRALPRTKPKALNYALAFARGEYVTIFDAEDLPDPDQLRRALEVLRAGGPELACVQARLAIHNTRSGWLARQFAVEYAGLFDVLMPAFVRFGQPLALGGTSNHFRIDALRAIGAWDPHNVTEDADIGMRLIRYGYRVGWVDSVTREEAPDTLLNWMGQRMRWLRGWMQTYAVHIREPARLAREVGFARFVSLQILLAGIVFSALVHPVFVVHLTYAAITGAVFVPQSTPVFDALLIGSAVNLMIGYGVVMEIGILGLYRAGRADLLAQVLLVPFYWMAISIAAYGALARFIISPFRWEKTRHRGTPAEP